MTAPRKATRRRGQELAGNYGVVRILEGRYAGKLGYYDDDVGRGSRVVVYLGTPCLSRFIQPPIEWLRAATRREEMEFTASWMTDIAYARAVAQAKRDGRIGK